ncbi:putative FBD domain, leucine-rich repeat domain superfamily, F-box-like domain superfamily [Helianthus annuus]|nr:putative FBD domain, leucine-rich repeat domain superfamily, F-box-like domain superfamily [Helianthus annuus]
MDRISKLPVGVIETILCLLPIQEAARTSILSKEWTRGPKPSAIELHLNKPSKRKDMAKRCKFFYAIYQVLLMHEGPIHEFTLSMKVDTSCVEIDHIILHLSKKNTLKILKLEFEAGADEGHRLPISLFSLHQLTSLYLHGCALYQKRSFNEFGCLTTLYLSSVWTHKKTLHRLLSSCPLLKRLTLGHGMTILYDVEGSTIVDLFECVPVIECLYVVVFGVEYFLPKRLPKKLPTPLVHLKYLCVDTLCFTHIYGLPFLALLIRSAPNLEKLKLVMWDESYVEDDVGSFTLNDYSDITLERLKEFEIQDFTDSENELDFVRLILAKSPVLKKLTVFPHYFFAKDDDLSSFTLDDYSELLFCSPCASPVVEIIVGWYKSDHSCPW